MPKPLTVWITTNCGTFFKRWECQTTLLLLLLSRFSRVRLCDPIDGSPPGSPVPEILQARTLEWVAISFLQGIFSTQGANPGLLHFLKILYCLNHQKAPLFKQKTAYAMSLCDWSSDVCSSDLSEEGNGPPLQYSCLESPTGGGAW